jgi:transcriptional regulator
MYIRGVHAEPRIPVLRQLVRDHPLGLLITGVPSDAHAFLQASHIPFVLEVADESSETELGKLRGHLARQNPQSKAVVDALKAAASEPGAGRSVLEHEVLVIFTAGAQHYVTPQFYVETKPDTAKVVPTWNYAAVQVYGRATVYYDGPETSAFLDSQLAALSQHAETEVMGYTGAGGRPGPWKVDDAPERYVEVMKRAIIGIEIEITRLEGKFKMSQEMSKGDRAGVVEGFRGTGTEIGCEVARLVQERGDLKEASKQ